MLCKRTSGQRDKRAAEAEGQCFLGLTRTQSGASQKIEAGLPDVSDREADHPAPPGGCQAVLLCRPDPQIVQTERQGREAFTGGEEREREVEVEVEVGAMEKRAKVQTSGPAESLFV